MNIPKSWTDITVGQFQRIYQYLHGTHEETFTPDIRHIEWVSVITELREEELYKVPLKTYTEALQKLQWLSDLTPLEQYPVPQQVRLGHINYTLCLEASKLTAGQFIDLTTFTKSGDTIGNLHLIMAALLIPRGGVYDGTTHAERAALVQNEMLLCMAYPTAVFFSNLLNLSCNVIKVYLVKDQLQMKRHLTQRLKRMKNAGVGL